MRQAGAVVERDATSASDRPPRFPFAFTDQTSRLP